MWGRGLFFEDLDRVWEALPKPKHGAIYQGEHYDYLRAQPGCPVPRGPCEALGHGTADLIALFLSRYTPVQLSPLAVPESLEPPNAPLSQEQQFFAGGRVGGLQTLTAADECEVELRWHDAGSPGSRVLYPDPASK